MTTYISILRGINLGGHNALKMEMLKSMCALLGFKSIRTYIQSGNIVFCAKQSDTKKLEHLIAAQIKIDFGYDVPVIVLSTKTLAGIIEANPFANNLQRDSAFLHVTFLAETPTHFDGTNIMLSKQGDEECAVTPRAVYLYCPHGYGKTKLNNGFFEKKLSVCATTRNWKTVTQLHQIASN